MTGARKRVDVIFPYGLRNIKETTGFPPVFEYFSGQSTQELLYSEGHPWPPQNGSQANLGGRFECIRRIYDETEPLYIDLSRSGTRFRGYQYASSQNPRDVGWPVISPTLDSSLEALGTKIIANVIPTNPLSNLTQFLGELREGLPSLVGTDFFKHRASVARNAGSEYLNVQFGWLPLISDLKKFAHAVKDSDALIKQYERNSGKRVKRVVRLPDEKTQSVQNLGNTRPTPVLATELNAYVGASTLTLTNISRTETWFSGAFTYYLPPFKANDSNVKRNEQLLNYLYGTRPTPEVLWNLAPWSWAADWFGNFGSVLHNVSAFANDGLVMPYAYLMQRKTSSKEYSGTTTYRDYGRRTLRQKYTTVYMKRIKASPYGFGLLPGDLSTRQWSIITALGLTKGSKYKTS